MLQNTNVDDGEHNTALYKTIEDKLEWRYKSSCKPSYSSKVKTKLFSKLSDSMKAERCIKTKIYIKVTNIQIIIMTYYKGIVFSTIIN